MKLKTAAMLLIFALLLSGGAAAYAPEDFANGAPSGIAEQGGALLVTDTFNKVIWKIENGTVVKLAGIINTPDMSGEPIGRRIDGKTAVAEFMEPWAITPYLDGFAVSDSAANVIRYVTETEVRTLAGSGSKYMANGYSYNAGFNMPTGLASDGAGRLYIADTGNNAIRVMDKYGWVSVYARDIIEPTGLCWHDGALYAAETGRNRIIRLQNGEIETVAGLAVLEEDGNYEGGYTDGPVSSARFDHPQGVAVSSDGAVYVADTNNSAVRKIAQGRVTTVACSRGASEMPSQPRGLLIALDTLYVTDQLQQSLLALETEYSGYADVTNDMPCAETVKTAAERALTNGVGGGRFDPHGEITRAMFAVMLSRVELCLDGNAVIDGEAGFSDVSEDDWYAGAAGWAADNGIILGSGGKFDGDARISREQMVTMLYRYAKMPEADSDAAPAAFADRSEISDYALDAAAWAVESGIVGAGADGSFAPQGAVTRAQAFEALLRFMDAAGL